MREFAGMKSPAEGERGVVAQRPAASRGESGLLVFCANGRVKVSPVHCHRIDDDPRRLQAAAQ